MRLNTVVLVLILAALIIFTVFNYDALTAHQTIGYWWGYYASVPLGIVLVLITALTALLFYFLSSLADLRARAHEGRTLREMEALRASLDAQEGSRFAQLQAYLEQRFATLEANSNTELAAQMTTRVDRVRDELAADIGQLDDYIRRRLGDAPSTLHKPDTY